MGIWVVHRKEASWVTAPLPHTHTLSHGHPARPPMKVDPTRLRAPPALTPQPVPGPLESAQGTLSLQITARLQPETVSELTPCPGTPSPGSTLSSVWAKPEGASLGSQKETEEQAHE